MINPDIDIAAVRTALARDGRFQVRDFLQSAAAERLHHCLDVEVPWTLALCDEAGMRTIPHSEYASMDEVARHALFARLAESACGGHYRFAYDSYMMPRAYLEGRDPHLLLHRVLEFLNSPGYLRFLRELTGEEHIRRVDAQATRYRAGQFLRTHNDAHSGEGRLFAYVINLTRRWQTDWGSLLHFVDENGDVTGSFMPRWNSLSLFRVPAGHAVSLVAPWAEDTRYAITGWLLASEREQ